MVKLQAEKRQRQIEAAERAKRAAAEAQRNLELFRQQNGMGPGPSSTPDAEPNPSGAASATNAQVNTPGSCSFAHAFCMLAKDQNWLFVNTFVVGIEVKWCTGRGRRPECRTSGEQRGAHWPQHHGG